MYKKSLGVGYRASFLMGWGVFVFLINIIFSFSFVFCFMHPLQKNRLLGRKYAIISVYSRFTDTLSVIKCNKNNSLVVQNFTKYLFLALLCRFCPIKCRKQTSMHLGSGKGHQGIQRICIHTLQHTRVLLLVCLNSNTYELLHSNSAFYVLTQVYFCVKLRSSSS